VFAVLEALLDEEGLEIDDCAGSDDCDEVRDRVLTLALATNEFLTGTENLDEIGPAFVRANDAAFDGADADLIEEILDERGLLGGGPVVVDPDGEPTGDAPAVEISADITHTFRGDVEIQAVVLDGSGSPLCDAITLRQADPQDSGDNVSGSVDVSSSGCAEFVPPSPDQQWVLLVQDTASQDTGQVNSFIVTVDGQPFLATGVPKPIPDADPTGIAVVVNDSGTDVPQPGTEAPGDADGGVPFATIELAHTFLGDLQVRVGVVDPGSGTIVCSIPVLEPDPQDDSDGASGDVDLSACAGDAVPGTAWFLLVVDTAAADVGTIERFDVFDAAGALVGSADVPVSIPDDDPEGAVAAVAA
jgi:subtilisin-like proprotein convertase family protein